MHSVRFDDQDESAQTRVGLKWVTLAAVVVLVLVGVATATSREANDRLRSFSLEKTSRHGLHDPNHVMTPFFERAPAVAISADGSFPGMVNGLDTEWVSAPAGQNCDKVCSANHMTAVKRGNWASGNKQPFYVCAAKSSVSQHPGMRAGFNLPGWNNGQCCIAYGSWQNRPQMECLCNHANSKARWVSNQGKYSSCTRVCGKDKLVAVSSGAFLGVPNNPRYEICSADGKCPGLVCDGRIGWNLGLIPFGNICASGWGSGYTRTTQFHCFCDVPHSWCEPANARKQLTEN